MARQLNNPLCTPDDLLAMPDGVAYELVDGMLVERNMGARASQIGLTIGRLIANFLSENQIGDVFGADCGYQCFPESPETVLKPDVSFIRTGSLPDGPPEGNIPVPPDLVVEVLTADDLVFDTDRKVEQYLRVGVHLVWVVQPETLIVTVFRGDGTIQGFRAEHELDGEEVLPGFHCQVSDFFRT